MKYRKIAWMLVFVLAVQAIASMRAYAGEDATATTGQEMTKISEGGGVWR